MANIILKQTNFNIERQLLEFDAINSDGELIGFAQLRLLASKSNEMPKGFESNVYYEVAPDKQGKGYATQILRLLRKEAAQRDLSSIMATTNSDNIASIRTIEKNGGELQAKGITTKGNQVLKFILSAPKNQFQ